jgi:hypothetical protein
LRGRGPLSLLLFVLDIDHLHHILCKTTDQGNLHMLRGRPYDSHLCLCR